MRVGRKDPRGLIKAGCQSSVDVLVVKSNRFPRNEELLQSQMNSGLEAFQEDLLFSWKEVKLQLQRATVQQTQQLEEQQQRNVDICIQQWTIK